MTLVDEYSHRYGEDALRRKGTLDEIRSFCAGDVAIEKGAGPAINEQFRLRLQQGGWGLDARVHPSYNLEINALKQGVGLTIQTGNIARAFYDLLKLQAMHLHGRIDCAVLIVPSSEAASQIGSNVANFERVSSELKLFSAIIFVPCLLIAIG